MFELQILFGNLVAPLVIAVATWFTCRFLPASQRGWLYPELMTVGGSVAIWAAIAIRNGFSWWPEDAWQQVPTAALLVTLVSLVVVWINHRSESTHVADRSELPSNNEHSTSQHSARRSSISVLIHGGAVTLAAFAAAWLAFPSGEAWAELQSQRAQWCLVIALATGLTWWGTAGCKPATTTAVGFSMIPLLIASAFLTSLSIMKVTEPLIAVATVLGICSVADAWQSGRKALPVLIAPAMFAMSGFIANANFQSYLGLPRTLYFLAMLSPAIVALAARMAQRKSNRVSIAVTLGAAVLLALGIAAWTYVAGDVGAEPEW